MTVSNKELAEVTGEKRINGFPLNYMEIMRDALGASNLDIAFAISEPVSLVKKYLNNEATPATSTYTILQGLLEEMLTNSLHMAEEMRKEFYATHKPPIYTIPITQKEARSLGYLSVANYRKTLALASAHAGIWFMVAPRKRRKGTKLVLGLNPRVADQDNEK